MPVWAQEHAAHRATDSFSHFYKDFLTGQDHRRRDLLMLLKGKTTRAQGLRQSSTFVFALLGILSQAQDDVQWNAFAQFAIGHLKAHKGMLSASQKMVFALLHAKHLATNRDFAGALLLLRPLVAPQEERPHAFFNVFPLAAPVYLECLLRAHLWHEALSFYAQHEHILEQSFHWEKQNELFVELSKAALFFDNVPLAVQFLQKPLLWFPKEAVGQEAMAVLSRIECVESPLKNGNSFLSPDNMHEVAKEVYKKIGKHTQSSQSYLLALMGVPVGALQRPELLIPAQSVDTLSAAQKARLLGLCELLVFVREYTLAQTVLKYLSKATLFDHVFEQEKILDLSGRVWNALHRPLEAANFYHTLFTKLPGVPLAAGAKLKYALSLHYGKKHEKALQFSLQNNVFETASENIWFAFWQGFLAKDFLGDSLQRAQEILKKSVLENREMDVRFRYWLWVNAKEKSLKEFLDTPPGLHMMNVLAQENCHFPYPLFAKWRLEAKNLKNLPQGHRQKSSSMAQAAGAEALVAKQNNVFLTKKIKNKNLEFIRNLILFHAEKEGAFFLKQGNFKKLTKQESVVLAYLAFGARDFSLAMELSRGLLTTEKDAAGHKKPPNLAGPQGPLWKLAYPLAYWEEVQSAAKLANIDPLWVLSVMRAESLYVPNAQSPVGALGLMQMMPSTGDLVAQKIGKKNFSVSDLTSPGESVAFAAWYLRFLLDAYGGNLFLATAAYNAGPVAVHRWLEQNKGQALDVFYENIPYAETKKYVGKVFGFLNIYDQVYLGKEEGYTLENDFFFPKEVSQEASELF